VNVLSLILAAPEKPTEHIQCQECAITTRCNHWPTLCEHKRILYHWLKSIMQSMSANVSCSQHLRFGSVESI
jgi:hypothetical protein